MWKVVVFPLLLLGKCILHTAKALAVVKRGHSGGALPWAPPECPIVLSPAPLQPCLPFQPYLSLPSHRACLWTSDRHHFPLRSCSLIFFYFCRTPVSQDTFLTIWLNSAWTWRCGSNPPFSVKTLVISTVSGNFFLCAPVAYFGCLSLLLSKCALQTEYSLRFFTN